MKYRKLKGYSVRSEWIYRKIHKSLREAIKQGNNNIPDLETNEIKEIIEDCNKLAADKLIESSLITLPFIGRLEVIEKTPKIDLVNNVINLPKRNNLTRQMKQNKELADGKFIYNTNIRKLIEIYFSKNKAETHNKVCSFRLNNNLFKKIAQYVNENNVILFKKIINNGTRENIRLN